MPTTTLPADTGDIVLYDAGYARSEKRRKKEGKKHHPCIGEVDMGTFCWPSEMVS